MSEFIFPSKDCGGCNRLIASPNCVYGGKCLLYNNNSFIVTDTTTNNGNNSWINMQQDKFKIEIYKGFLELILSGKCAFAVPENSVYHVKDFGLSNNIEDVEIISDTYISIDDVIKQYNEYLPLTDKDGE